MLIRTAICDNNINTCSEIERILLDFADCHGLQVEAEMFYSLETFYNSLRNECVFDIILLDAQLLVEDSIQLGRQVKKLLRDKKATIAYLSSAESYAMSLFHVNLPDFLIKPVTEGQIAALVKKHVHLNMCKRECFYYRIGKSLRRLYLDEIYYFTRNGKKIEAYVGSGKEAFYGVMHDIWERIEGKGFLIIHRSYMVNTAFISVCHDDSVQLTDGTILPVSRRYRKHIKELLSEKYQKG